MLKRGYAVIVRLGDRVLPRLPPASEALWASSALGRWRALA